MKKGYLIIFVFAALVICDVIYLNKEKITINKDSYANVNKVLENNKYEDDEEETKEEISINESKQSIDNNSNKDEKIKIARNLFDKYINEKATIKKGEKTVRTFNDYRIKDIDFIREKDNQYTVQVCYDIQCTNKSNYWVAGNGEVTDDNWVINKVDFVDIVQDGDKYSIKNVYTG